MTDNKRTDNRSQVVLKIKFKSENLDQFIQRYSVDVSQGGIFIRTKKPLAVGQKLRFEFQLRDSSPLIMGQGVVMWTREKDPARPDVAPGMGVRFESLEGDSRKTIKTVLAEKVGGDDERFGTQAASPSNEFSGSSTKVAPDDLVDKLSNEEEKEPTETKVPKPVPFQTDAADYSQDTFEESTRVASVDALMGLEEESSPFVPLEEHHVEDKAAQKPVEAKPIEQIDVDQTTEAAKEKLSGAAAEAKNATSERPKAATLPPAQVQEEKKSSNLPILLVLSALVAGGVWFVSQQNKPQDITEPPPVQTQPVTQTEPLKTEPLKQRLMVESIPSSAYVIVNDKALEKVTPLELNMAPGAEQKIAVKRLGYQTKTVDLPTDPTQAALKVSLTPKPVTLAITSTPPGAQVFINGSRKPGKTPMDLKLTEASQDALVMVIKKEGFQDVTMPLSMKDFVEEENQWKGSATLELPAQEKVPAIEQKTKSKAKTSQVKSVSPTPTKNVESQTPQAKDVIPAVKENVATPDIKKATAQPKPAENSPAPKSNPAEASP